MVYIRRLIWDAWNVEHIAAHNVSPQDVEEVCRGSPIEDETYAERIRLIGPTASGNLITVILAPQEQRGAYYPVTARPASRRERRRYRQRKGGDGR